MFILKKDRLKCYLKSFKLNRDLFAELIKLFEFKHLPHSHLMIPILKHFIRFAPLLIVIKLLLILVTFFHFPYRKRKDRQIKTGLSKKACCLSGYVLSVL